MVNVGFGPSSSEWGAVRLHKNQITWQRLPSLCEDYSSWLIEPRLIQPHNGIESRPHFTPLTLTRRDRTMKMNLDFCLCEDLSGF